MIRFYRIFTLISCFIGTIYVSIDVRDLIFNPSLYGTEDTTILLFIVAALYFEISFSLETRKLSGKKTRHFEVIDAEKIKRSLKRKKFNEVFLYGNLMIGILIVLFVGIIVVSNPWKEFRDDISRLISIVMIVFYGLIQIHFSLIVRKKIKKEKKQS